VRLLLQLGVGRLQLLLAAPQLLGERLRLLEEALRRVFARIVFSTMPIDSMSWSRNIWWVALKRSKEASSMTACTPPSKRTGSTMMLSGGASPRPEEIWT